MMLLLLLFLHFVGGVLAEKRNENGNANVNENRHGIRSFVGGSDCWVLLFRKAVDSRIAWCRSGNKRKTKKTQ